MKLQSQVCSLEQSKRLKELGIIQTSIACYLGTELNLFERGVYNWAEQNNINALAAYTVAELGVMLPNVYMTWATHIRPLNKGTYCHVVYETNPWGAYETEARGRAALLIYLLENNLITPEEVNNRLLNS